MKKKRLDTPVQLLRIEIRIDAFFGVSYFFETKNNQQEQKKLL